jgi:hypothetical protein
LQSTILILGGYGTFGGRLAQLLADDPRCMLVIAGRSLAKAEEFCKSRNLAAKARPLAFDREGQIERQLREIRPDVVVDASGPFQSYADPYRVVRACLTLGINYLDLADGSDFVKGISQFDAQAKARGIWLLSGASSFPVLTAAVVRLLSGDLKSVTSIVGGIAPSPYAGVGLNVVRAIAGYAGQPVEMKGGSRHYAFVDARRYTIAAPGRVPLKPIRFSLVDVPDLKVLPDLWPSVRSVWIGAGPVPAILHRALNALAWLVRARLIPSLSPFAPLMHRATNTLRWGEHRGGMFVFIEGANDDGKPVERSWHLIAEGDDGPLIPSMAAEAIIRHHLQERSPPPGARPATKDLEVSDYETLFARRAIYCGTRQLLPSSEPLYRRLLGDAWHRLPEPLKAMHDLRGNLTASGVATVRRGTSLLARLIGAMFGFPSDGEAVPVTVSFHSENGGEIWRRDFAGRSFKSTQEEGRGSYDRLMCERFGPFKFGIALTVEGARLNLIMRRWSVFGLALPLALAPTGETYETVENGRFTFNVEISHPWLGLVVRYRGWLSVTP